MKRKLLSVLFIFVLALGLYCFTAPDAYAVEAAGECGTNLAYVLTDNGNLYILGSGSMSGWSSSNPAPWSEYASQITNVHFSEEVTNVGDYAFSGCYNLTELSGTVGVTSIGSHAFDGCSSLYNMPEGASSIGSYAFRNCTNLRTAYISGSSLGEGVFSGCSSLSSASLSGGMSRIPSYTFYECYNLSSITLPSGLSSIGESAFDGAGIYSISIPSGVTEIGAKAFRRSHLTSFTLPASINEVPDRLLSDCYNLESLAIHEGVTKIHDNAFSGCSSLLGVNLPESLEYMGEGVFSGCSGLMTLNIKKNLKTIPISAFSDCTSLATLDIPSTVETISDEAFKGCTALTTVNVNEGVTTFGNSVFADCEALEDVTLPTSLKTVGDGIFSGCTALQQVKYAGYLSKWAKVEIGEDNELLALDKIATNYIDGGNLNGGSVWSVSRDGVLYISGTGSIDNFEQGSAPWRGHSTEITDVVIDSRITNLGSYCFEGLDQITEISLPRGVTRVSQGMFKDCTALVTVTGMDNVKNIGDSGFENCASLAIDIPTVITLGNRAFAGCKTLDTIILNCDSVGDGAFENCVGLKKIVIRNNVHNIGVGAFAGCEPKLANFVGSQEELKALTIGADNEPLTKVLGIYYYIKNVYLGYGGGKKEAVASIADKTYHIIEIDLNGQGEGYVCIGYSLTNDIDEALTDIKVFTTSLKTPAGSMEINGVNYFLLSQPISTNSDNITTFLCTTKDQTAGDPIAMIGLVYGDKSTFNESESWEQVINVNGSEANLSGNDQLMRLYFTGDMTADFNQPIGGSALYLSIAAVIVTMLGGLGILLYVAKTTGKKIKLSKTGILADDDTDTAADEAVEPEMEPTPTADDLEVPDETELTPDDLFDIEIPDFDYEDEQKTPGELLSGAGAKIKGVFKKDKTEPVERTELDEEPKTFKERASEAGAKIKEFFVKIRDAVVGAWSAIIHAEIWKKLSDRVKNPPKKEKPAQPKKTGKSAKKSQNKETAKTEKKPQTWWDKRQAYDEEQARKAKAKKERERRKAMEAKNASNSKKGK